MIVRSWKAEIMAGNVPAYRDFLAREIFPRLTRLPGCAGAELLLSGETGEVGVLVQSRWTSLDAIRGFAGDRIDRAVVEPEAQALLKRFDDFATHYEVALEAPV